MTYRETYRHLNVMTDIQMDITPSIYLSNKPNILRLRLTHVISFAYLKLAFLHLKGLENLLENLQTAMGMNPHCIYPKEVCAGHET